MLGLKEVFECSRTNHKNKNFTNIKLANQVIKIVDDHININIIGKQNYV